MFFTSVRFGAEEGGGASTEEGDPEVPSRFPPDMVTSSTFIALFETGVGFVMIGSMSTSASPSPFAEIAVSIIFEDQIVLGDIVILYWDYSGVINERGS